MLFAPDGKLFITSGDRQRFEPAQSTEANLGKIVRINADGSIPADNPFVNKEGTRPEIWSLGHRNPLGAAINPASKQLWIHEMGPWHGDEVNVPEPGKNYGWPVVSNGENYDGTPIPDHAMQPEYPAPMRRRASYCGSRRRGVDSQNDAASGCSSGLKRSASGWRSSPPRWKLTGPREFLHGKERAMMVWTSLVLVLASATTSLAGPATKAVAVLTPTQGNHAAGKVVFTTVKGAVKVSVNLTGLKEGAHGFHIHEFGDYCSAPDGGSAGGHFDPAGNPHAGPKDPKRHLGDLGNVEAAADGKVTLDFTDAQLSLEGPNGILGRSVIVHANADDLETQPTGNAGGRLACGVVGIASPE